MCLVEWADLITEILPPGVVYVKIEKDLTEEDLDHRKITVGGQGEDDGIERVESI